MTELVWRETFRIRSFDADARARLSVAALLGLFEEAAGNHAGSYGVSVEQLFQRNLTWVLARFRLRVARWPAWRDEVTIETWPSGFDAVRAFRDYRLLDAATGEILARAGTVWMVLDVERRRPVHVPDFIRTIRCPERAREVGSVVEPVERPARADRTASFSVRYDDLDLNRHANHVCYTQWAVETVPVEVRDRGALAEADVDFRAEAVLGDEVVAEAEDAGGSAAGHVFRHRIRTANGARDLAFLRTTWR